MSRFALLGAGKLPAGGAFDPYSLWNGTSRSGYWWDPSDTTSLWKQKDLEVNSNVASDGDQIRMILDKSRMGGLTAAAWLASRTNEFETPDFSADTNWSKGTGWTIAGGKAVATAVANNVGIWQGGFVANAVYYVEFTISNYSSGGIKLFTTPGFGTVVAAANGTYKGFVRRDNSNDAIGFAANGSTTLELDNVFICRLHDGTANVGVWQGNAATVLYKTGSGKHWIRFPGTDVDNVMYTATGQGLTTGEAINLFMGIDPLSDTSTVLIWQSATVFAGVYSAGAGTSPDAGAGTITYYVDGTLVSGATRDTLNTAIAGAKRVVELRGIDTSLVPNLAPYFYGSSGFGGLADVYQIIGAPSMSAGEISSVISYIQGKQ